jgi:GNAT superfamily N-acetyltransferase
MRHDLGDGYELDDDRERIDVAAVNRYLSMDSYWASGRPYDVDALLLRQSYGVVGLYHRGAQVGFCRIVSDGAVLAYLADLYVLPEHRGRGLGVAMVREAVVNGPPVRRWLLHTRDAHPLYARFGFGPASDRVMELDVRDRRDPLAEELELPIDDG